MCLWSHLEVLFQDECAFPPLGHEASERFSFSTDIRPKGRAVTKIERSERRKIRHKERRKDSV